MRQTELTDRVPQFAKIYNSGISDNSMSKLLFNSIAGTRSLPLRTDGCATEMRVSALSSQVGIADSCAICVLIRVAHYTVKICDIVLHMNILLTVENK